jgi:hypothetical protein
MQCQIRTALNEAWLHSSDEHSAAANRLAASMTPLSGEEYAIVAKSADVARWRTISARVLINLHKDEPCCLFKPCLTDPHITFNRAGG